ncbi:MAG: hypothetical protein O2843_11845, partial [Chloroflexi bacterium]|nr:hypothetical protein [Chloroflexota bacterium]
MTTPYVLSLDDPAAADAAVTGGKAAALATMRAAGLPVPAGFVITAHAFAAVSAALADQIADELATLEHGATAREVGDRLVGLLAKARVPADVRAAVRGAYATLAGTALAVRSSATVEDLAGASFAGQYESFLGVTSERLLWRRTRDVWASLHAPRVLSYRAARGFAHDDARMAVLVQTLVPARAAGVLFTCDPITGARDRVVINATHGLAEALVSGRSTADVYVLDALTYGVSERTVVDKPLALRLGADGRVRRARVPPWQRRAPALDDHELAALGALAARVRTLFGDERDVEFALDGDGPRLVQARPVTVVAARPPPFTVHWDDAEDEQRFWARMGDEPAYRLEAEIRERATGDMRRSFERTGAPFTRAYLMRHIHGYRYQASPAVDERDVIARQRRWRARAERHLDRGITLYFAEIEPATLALLERLEGSRPTAGASAANWLAYTRRAISTWARVLHDLHWRMAGGRTGDHLPSVYSEVTGAAPIEAAVLLQAADNQTVRLVRRLRALARVVQSDRALARAIGRREFDRLARPPLRDRPATRLLLRKRDGLLRDYGQRTGYGFGSATRFLEPTWNMEPDRVLEVVATYAQSDLDALGRREALAKRERARALRAARALAARDPELAARFERALRSATATMRSMENHNHLMEQRTGGLLREALHELGRALVAEGSVSQAEDVFHLSLDECASAARRGARARDLRPLVRTRAAERTEQLR